MESVELAFMQEVLANPQDDLPRLIYADWLEENHDPRAEYLRLECQLKDLTPQDALYQQVFPRLEEIRVQIAPAWLAQMGRTVVYNCPRVRSCPRQWTALQQTQNLVVAHCQACNKQVYYCQTISEVLQRSTQRRIFAVDSALRCDTRIP